MPPHPTHSQRPWETVQGGSCTGKSARPTRLLGFLHGPGSGDASALITGVASIPADLSWRSCAVLCCVSACSAWVPGLFLLFEVIGLFALRGLDLQARGGPQLGTPRRTEKQISQGDLGEAARVVSDSSLGCTHGGQRGCSCGAKSWWAAHRTRKHHLRTVARWASVHPSPSSLACSASACLTLLNIAPAFCGSSDFEGRPRLRTVRLRCCGEALVHLGAVRV